MGFDFLKWFLEQDERKYIVIICVVFMFGVGYIGFDLYNKNIQLTDEKSKSIKDCETEKMEMSKEFRGFMNQVIIDQNKRISEMDSQNKEILKANLKVEQLKSNLNGLKDEINN